MLHQENHRHQHRHQQNDNHNTHHKQILLRFPHPRFSRLHRRGLWSSGHRWRRNIHSRRLRHGPTRYRHPSGMWPIVHRITVQLRLRGRVYARMRHSSHPLHPYRGLGNWNRIVRDLDRRGSGRNVLGLGRRRAEVLRAWAAPHCLLPQP